MSIKKNPFSESSVDVDNARFAEQIAVMKEIAAKGEDPFAMDKIVERGDKILKEGKYWFVIYNRWPYKNTKVHLLIITKENLTDLAQLNSAEHQEFFEMVNWAREEFKVPGGAFCFRFGDSNYSAGTVAHLHAQFIVPDVEGENYAPVRFKVGKDKEKLV